MHDKISAYNEALIIIASFSAVCIRSSANRATTTCFACFLEMAPVRPSPHRPEPWYTKPYGFGFYPYDTDDLDLFTGGSSQTFGGDLISIINQSARAPAAPNFLKTDVPPIENMSEFTNRNRSDITFPVPGLSDIGKAALGFDYLRSLGALDHLNVIPASIHKTGLEGYKQLENMLQANGINMFGSGAGIDDMQELKRHYQRVGGHVLMKDLLHFYDATKGAGWLSEIWEGMKVGMTQPFQAIANIIAGRHPYTGIKEGYGRGTSAPKIFDTILQYTPLGIIGTIANALSGSGLFDILQQSDGDANKFLQLVDQKGSGIVADARSYYRLKYAGKGGAPVDPNILARKITSRAIKSLVRNSPFGTLTTNAKGLNNNDGLLSARSFVRSYGGNVTSFDRWLSESEVGRELQQLSGGNVDSMDALLSRSDKFIDDYVDHYGGMLLNEKADFYAKGGKWWNIFKKIKEGIVRTVKKGKPFAKKLARHVAPLAKDILKTSGRELLHATADYLTDRAKDSLARQLESSNPIKRKIGKRVLEEVAKRGSRATKNFIDRKIQSLSKKYLTPGVDDDDNDEGFETAPEDDEPRKASGVKRRRRNCPCKLKNKRQRRKLGDGFTYGRLDRPPYQEQQQQQQQQTADGPLPTYASHAVRPDVYSPYRLSSSLQPYKHGVLNARNERNRARPVVSW